MDIIMKRLSVCLFIMVGIALTAMSATTADVRKMFQAGNFEDAARTGEALLKKSPRDGELNYWYGRAALALNRVKEAKTALTTAGERGYTDAYAWLTDISFKQYDVDAAEKYIDQWRAALTKAKKPEPDNLDLIEDRLLMMTNQLNRIEDIPVIARYDVSADDFNKALEGINGSTTGGYTFLNGRLPFYIGNNMRQVFWTESDKKGINRLFTAGILDDGTRDEAVELTQYIGEGDIRAPFMLQDGETLYFASNNNENGLGGYDIYMTRTDGEGGFYEPTNVGMPYNSPNDDLMYVLDEDNNIGWWVTNRFTGPDSVSIMVFVPNTNRINLNVGDEQRASRAFVGDIAATRPAGFALDAAMSRIPTPDNKAVKTNNNPSFAISLGDGRIITSYEQLSSSDSVDAVNDILEAREFLVDIEKQLSDLRMAYKKGNTGVKNDIRQLETELERQQNYVKTYTNRLIRLESSAR